MARSYNKVVLVGHLGRDPEMRYTPSGKAVTTLSLATDRPSSNGEKGQTDWHTITVWGRQAEACNQYLTKGRLVLVEGSIQTDRYEQDGVTKYFTKIVARAVNFLDGPSESAAPDEEEEIPF